MPPERVINAVNNGVHGVPVGLRDPGRRPSRSEALA
jgi:hypothetical protein